jgi:hypothetical protein
MSGYRKCQQVELLNAMRHYDEPPEKGNCDGNAKESVNLPDREHMDEPAYDRLFWVCSEHFEQHYHSYIVRGVDGQCDCVVCRAVNSPAPTLPAPCPGCGMMLDEMGIDVEGCYHYGPGGCANRHLDEDAATREVARFISEPAKNAKEAMKPQNAKPRPKKWWVSKPAKP